MMPRFLDDADGKKYGLLEVPISQMKARMAAGEKLTEQDIRWLAEEKVRTQQLIADIKSSFQKRIEHIAPWFDHSNYAYARLCGVLSNAYKGEPLESWLDIPNEELLGYIDALKPESDIEKTIVAAEQTLTDNDVGLLETMLSMNLSSTSLASREQILKQAKWQSEGKRAFTRLMKQSLVGSQQGVGYYLTDKGIETAKKLGART